MCSVVSDSLWPHGLYSLRGSSVHGIFQARILEWIAISYPGDLPDPGIKPTSLASLALAGVFFTISAIWEDFPTIGYHEILYIVPCAVQWGSVWDLQISTQLGWALIQCDWCLYRRKSGRRGDIRGSLAQSKGHSKKEAVCKSGGEASGETKPATTFAVNFQPLHMWGNTSPLLKPHPVCGVCYGRWSGLSQCVRLYMAWTAQSSSF